MTRATTSTEDRALQLLGSGVIPEQVAAALGVTVSRISQLLSDPEFTAQVAELRFDNLQEHNNRDSRYNKMEDSLLEKLEDLIPLMMRPMEVLKAIQVINAAKRRGAAAPDHITSQSTVVNLNMPIQIIQKFSTNIHNQVVTTGGQDLLTMQSSTLLSKLKGTTNERTPQFERIAATV